jgi:site-specific recombinase XerD
MSVTPRSDAREERCGDPALPVHDLVERVIEDLRSEGNLTEASFERLSGLMLRFGSFVDIAFCLRIASDVGAEHVVAFLNSSSESGSPSVGTQHLRRSAIRLLYHRALMLGASLVDPTRDVVLPPRSYLSLRPLTDDEVELCRSFARRSLSATREPAAWALSEASARCSELPYIRVHDIDVCNGSVFIAGGAKTASRYGELSDWGLVQVNRRLRELPAKDPEVLLLGAATRNHASARASAYDAIRTTLDRAGLGHEPDVRPNSVVAWRGASALASGASIDEVARMLGIRSLDAAASFIGWHWQGEEP